jgi:hypothetical protein
MSLFSRRPRTVIPASVLDALAPYGQAVIDARRAGRPLVDPRYDWSNFVGIVHMALFDGDRDRIVGELYDSAMASSRRETAVVGAYRLLAECNERLEDHRFLELQDATLEHFRSIGFSSGHLTGHEARRWIETHDDLRTSFDGVV